MKSMLIMVVIAIMHACILCSTIADTNLVFSFTNGAHWVEGKLITRDQGGRTNGYVTAQCIWHYSATNGYYGHFIEKLYGKKRFIQICIPNKDIVVILVDSHMSPLFMQYSGGNDGSSQSLWMIGNLDFPFPGWGGVKTSFTLQSQVLPHKLSHLPHMGKRYFAGFVRFCSLAPN